ncbi:MAG: hypothetical protein KAU62_10755, partial [Candidatus Heimdallarchaeota archaeon]|nr:hypothetical protein [Candidatus Heimdallarchaeota archaeon]MCK4611624.1 hypothetical protein [Candidatus Heimdallarchaeota archaeon]
GSKNIIKNALNEVISPRLALIVTKTKAERVILSLLANEIENKNESILTGIEYSYSKINKSLTGRADLALLMRSKNNDYKPKALVEGKLFFTFDAVDGVKTNDKDKWDRFVDTPFENDLKKLEKVSSLYDRYFIIFLVHYDSKKVPEYFKYSSTHNRVVKKKKYSKASELLFEAEDRINSTFKMWNDNYRRIDYTNEDIYTKNIGQYKGIMIKLVVGIAKVI